MHDFRKSLVNSALRKVLKRLHYPLEVMLICVRWYVAYPLSLRHIEEMMQERGVFVDHVRVHRWAIKVLPVLAAVFCRRKRPMGRSWRMDETYIKVSGQWKYLYRAVDRAGDAVDFLLTAKRDLAAARRFLERAINLHDVPEKITIDKSGANTAAHLERQGRRLRGYPDASKQIPQQHRRAGPPGHQTNHPTDARVQVVLERANYHRRDRNHAHDSQGADELPRRLSHVRSTAVLQPRSLITRSATQLFSARVRYRDRTHGRAVSHRLRNARHRNRRFAHPGLGPERIRLHC